MTVKNLSNQKGFNRVHERQRAILEALPAAGDCKLLSNGELVQDTATTGAVLDALGLPRTPANYASVSRSLDRLAQRGLVAVYRPALCRQGRGYLYARACSPC